jgi:hypothetical protein
MRFCAWCGAALPAEKADASGAFGECPLSTDTTRDADKATAPLQEPPSEKRDLGQSVRVIWAILWLVLPVAGGIVAASHGVSFWIGFFCGGLANGILRFLANPFGA